MKKTCCLILCAVLLFAGCSASPVRDPASDRPAQSPAETASPVATEAVRETEPAPETETEPVPETEAPSSLAQLRQITAENGDICAVIFLGCLDWDVPGLSENPGAWSTFLEDCEYVDAYPFLTQIPEERILNAGGNELYCLIPVEERTAISVHRAELDEESGLIVGTQDVLLECIDGSPFVVCCNVSDILPNAQITVMTSEDSIMWEPFLSLENGHVFIPDGVLLYDATVYPEP